MHDGQRGPQLLPWLNAMPAVLEVLDQHWGEEPITAQNLSDWRQGGYQDWLRKREKIETTKQLAEYCRTMGEAGAGQFGLPAALAGGAMMAALEDFDADTLKMLLAEKPGKLMEMMGAIAQLQASQAKLMQAEAGAATVKQREKALEQREAQLALNERRVAVAEQEFQRKTCELFLKWSADQAAKAIVDGPEPSAVKMDLLMKRMFGERPADLDQRKPWDVPKHSNLSGGG